MEDSECIVRLQEQRFLESPQQLDIQRSGDQVVSIGVGDRQGIVADFAPRVLWLDIAGQPATLLDAKMKIDERGLLASGRSQYYLGSRLVYGAHLASDEHRVGTIRFVLDAKMPNRWFDQSPTAFKDGAVRPWRRGDRLLGIEVELEDPLGIDEFVRRTVLPFKALLGLWTHRSVSHGHVEFYDSVDGWLPVHDFQDPEPPRIDQTKFLPVPELTVETLAKWLNVASILGPIAEMALHRSGPIQVDALVTTTAIEGCHRRLVRDPTSRVHYRTRVAEIVQEIVELVPGLLGPDPGGWIDEVKDIRNEQGHVFAKVDNFDEAQISRYYVYFKGAEWVLRLFLLLQVVERNQLSKHLQDCDKFWFTLANIDRENYWPEFSSYDTYRESLRGNC